jgi:N utilization substance protein A
MKSDFLLAITQLAAEKNLPREVVLGAVESALVSAYRKNSFTPTQNISAKIDPTSGRVEVWAEKTVVNKVSDPRCEISLNAARKIKTDVQLDDIINIEDTPHNAGRIAAQTAKQVILQRLHEAEHTAILEEYAGKEGEIISGVVRRIEPRQIFLDLGRTEAVIPAVEQSPNERYHIGQRLKVYLLEITQSAKGPLLIVSRSHPNLLRRFLELEVPEVYNGTVEIKAVAREAGFRSKVAVAARQESIDPVGCCVGLRGIRIQNIVNELNGEKIDVVNWSDDISTFMANALSPAKISGVYIDEKEKAATVVIPDKQLSLAIGKEGQNVRLAVKLTGWRIDIKSASEAEEERLFAAKEDQVEKDTTEGLLGETSNMDEETSILAEISSKPEDTIDASKNALKLPSSLLPNTEKGGQKELRFAEEIIPVLSPKPGSKTRKKSKKTSQRKEGAQDGIHLKKKRRSQTKYGDEEDEY